MNDSAAFLYSDHFESFGFFCCRLKQEVWVVCADTGLMLWMCGSRCRETVHHTHFFRLLSPLICSLYILLHVLIIYKMMYCISLLLILYFTSLLAQTCTQTGFARFVPLNWARLLGSPSSEVTDRDWRTFMFVSLWQRNKEMKQSNKQTMKSYSMATH